MTLFFFFLIKKKKHSTGLFSLGEGMSKEFDAIDSLHLLTVYVEGDKCSFPGTSEVFFVLVVFRTRFLSEHHWTGC